MRVSALGSMILAFAGTALAWNGTYIEDIPMNWSNPNNISFGLYLPPKLLTHAPVLLAMHCGGSSGKEAYETYGFNDYADQFGFPVIYPNEPRRKWETSSRETNTHDGGGESQTLIDMVKYVLRKYEGDPSRVFVTGFSSGSFITDVLTAVYPDVFAGAAVFASLPYGCLPDANGQSYSICRPECAQKNWTRTGEEWAQAVKDAYPGYGGYRPRMLVYHGTNDERCLFSFFDEQIKQYTSLFGISSIPVLTETNLPNTPESTVTRMVFGNDDLEAYMGVGDGHNNPHMGSLAFQFFDLACPPGDRKCKRRPAPIPDQHQQHSQQPQQQQQQQHPQHPQHPSTGD